VVCNKISIILTIKTFTIFNIPTKYLPNNIYISLDIFVPVLKLATQKHVNTVNPYSVWHKVCITKRLTTTACTIELRQYIDLLRQTAIFRIASKKWAKSKFDPPPGLGPINKNSQIWEIFSKRHKILKLTIFVRKVRKLILLMFQLGQLIRSLEMSFKTV
jgi:hypothetical protein